MNAARRMCIAAAAGMALLCSAHAAVISGGISLAGGYTVNTGNLNTATSFTAFSGNFVTGVSGSFAAAGLIAAPNPGFTTVTMTPFTFAPPSTPVNPLWSTNAGPAASFLLTQITNVEQVGDNTLDLTGRGTLKLVGYEDTMGDWVFTANQAGGTFSWSSSNAPVPEGGTSAALLGLALLAVGIAARRRQLT